MNPATQTRIPNSTVTISLAAPASFFSISGLRVRPWPILAVIGLGLVILLLAVLAGNWVTQRLGMERSMAILWLAGYVDHAVMLVIALVLIIWLL